jgi:hypothetical protein
MEDGNDNGNLDFYDLIIDIESFNDLKSEGWKIIMSQDGNDKYEYYKNESDQKEKKRLNRIGVLGVSDVGKTFIIKKLINKKDNIIQKKTKGISVIYPEKGSDNLFVCLDSQGSEEPIIDKKKTEKEIYDLKEKDRKSLVKELTKDKKFTEIFIQDFIIEKSNILIVVVDQLTFSEQKLINRLKYNKNFDKLFVIHNTQFFEKIKTIEEHIKNVIEKSIFSNLKKGIIPNFKRSENEQPNLDNIAGNAYYLKEKEIGKGGDSGQVQEIIHLFMGKEGSEAGNFFNEQTIEYIRYLIKAETRTKLFDVIEEVKQFLSFNSNLYMVKDNKDRPIKLEDIELNKSDDVTYLHCKNKNFQLKECVINEMGISNFTTENSINPAFVCYKGRFTNKKTNEDWPALIIKTEMFAEKKNIKIYTEISEDNENMNITISCEKKLEEEKDIEGEIEEIEGGDIKSGTMKINIKLNLNDISIDFDEKPRIREPFDGIKLIYFKINEKKK